MKQVLDSIHKAGPNGSHVPRLIGEILRELLSASNNPLTQAFREHNGMVNVEQSNADSYGKE